MGKGKQRNSRKLRPQEYDDFDSSDYGVKPDVDNPGKIEAPTREAPKPASAQVQSLYRLGQVVFVPNKHKLGEDPYRIGTIVQISASEAWVLDVSGVIHVAKLGELGSAEKS